MEGGLGRREGEWMLMISSCEVLTPSGETANCP
jgi:hypothetical protein